MAFTIGSTLLAMALFLSPLPPHAQEPAPPPTAPAPTPDASGVYHVGKGVSAPKVLYAPEPEFSEKARKKKIGGSCTVSLNVDITGNPRDVRIVSSLASNQSKKLRAAALSLDDQALKAVRQYRFAPALLNGKPVPVTINVEINFQIF